MDRYFNVNKLVNSLTNNEALKTYYTLLLMAESMTAKEAVDEHFWQKFDELDRDEKVSLRKALQNAEKNLLMVTQNLHQEVREWKDSLQSFRQAA